MFPGIELFLRRATPKLSWPQQRFTSEFGKGSVWFHRAIDTRKYCWVRDPEDCTVTRNQMSYEVKPSVC
jgi:hypothetical protein